MRKIFFIILLSANLLSANSQNLNDTLIKIGEVEIIDEAIYKKDGSTIICGETNIDSAILKQNNTQSFSELLSENSSVFIKSYGQGLSANASIRGKGTSHTQVLWNGIKLNNPMLGQTDLSLIPVFFIDKAKIFYGGNSLSGGSGALGGTIELSSEINTQNKFAATLIQTVGSNKTYQTFVKTGGNFSGFYTTFKFYHEQSQNDFEYYNTANGLQNYEKQKNADYYKNALLNETAFKLTKNKYLKLSTWVQGNYRNIPPVMSFMGAGRTEFQKDKEIRSILNIFGNRKKIFGKLAAGINIENINYFLADNINQEFFIHTNSESKTEQFFADYTLKFLRKKWEFTGNLSSEYQKAYYSDKKTRIGYKAKRQINELFIASYYKPGNFFNAYFLTRTNITDKKTYFPAYTAGAQYQPFKQRNLIFKTSFSKNFHLPSLNDLYWLPGGNPDLLPEKSLSGNFDINYELYKTKNILLLANISLFTSKTDNWIIWKPGNFGYWKAENIKKVFSRGSEFSFSGKYSSYKIKSSVKINMSYTKTTDETKQDINNSSFGKQLIYIPLYKANLFMNIEYKKLRLNFTHIFTGQRFTVSTNEETRHSLPYFNIDNISISRKLKSKKTEFEILFKIKNLFNVDYQEILWRAMPRRQYFISINFEFNKK